MAIRDHPTARIEGARGGGWDGEAVGLAVSLAAAEHQPLEPSEPIWARTG